MAKAPSKGTVTDVLEIYRRTDVSTGKEDLFYLDGDGVEKAVGGTAGGGSHAATHAEGGSDELIEASVSPTTQAFGDAAATGATLTKAAPVLHKHGMPADPVPAHVAAGDPHPVYALDSDLHAPVSLAADADVLLGLSGQQLTLDVQNQNKVLAGPASGADADPTFRALVDADIPASIARDSEVTTAVTNHEAAGDPHPGYALDSHTMASHTDDGALAVKNTIATADIDADAVTYAKMQNVTDGKLLGRSAGSAGDPQEISVGSGLSLAAGVLTSTGGAGGGTVGLATIDYGASPAEEGTVVVTGQAGILNTSLVEAWVQANDSTADNTTDDHDAAAEIMRVFCGNIVAGTGFTIYGRPQVGYVTGQFKVHWRWT